MLPRVNAPGGDSRHRGADTADIIERIALQIFYEKGYHGASIRAISNGAEVGVATLFHHYPSKAAILERIMDEAAAKMRIGLEEATEGLTDPTERLVAALRTFVLAHCERQEESFVAQSEFRRLDPKAFEEIRGKRRQVQAIFDDIVADGIAADQFSTEHPKEVARAIVALGTAVATWYRPGEGMAPAEVAEIHVEMALRLLLAKVPTAG